MAGEIQKTINFHLDLGIKNDYSHWKSLDELKMIVPSRRGIYIAKGRRNFNSPLLKMLLRGLGVLQSGIRAEYSNSRLEWVTKTT